MIILITKVIKMNVKRIIMNFSLRIVLIAERMVPLFGRVPLVEVHGG